MQSRFYSQLNLSKEFENFFELISQVTLDENSKKAITKLWNKHPMLRDEVGANTSQLSFTIQFKILLQTMRHKTKSDKLNIFDNIIFVILQSNNPHFYSIQNALISGEVDNIDIDFAILSSSMLHAIKNFSKHPLQDTNFKIINTLILNKDIHMLLKGNVVSIQTQSWQIKGWELLDLFNDSIPICKYMAVNKHNISTSDRHFDIQLLFSSVLFSSINLLSVSERVKLCALVLELGKKELYSQFINELPDYYLNIHPALNANALPYLFVKTPSKHQIRTMLTTLSSVAFNSQNPLTKTLGKRKSYQSPDETIPESVSSAEVEIIENFTPRKRVHLSETPPNPQVQFPPVGRVNAPSNLPNLDLTTCYPQFLPCRIPHENSTNVEQQFVNWSQSQQFLNRPQVPQSVSVNTFLSSLFRSGNAIFILNFQPQPPQPPQPPQAIQPPQSRQTVYEDEDDDVFLEYPPSPGRTK